MSETPPASSPRMAERPPSESDRRRRGGRVRDAFALCTQRRTLNRTVRIAIIVGIILTVINQGSLIASGHATLATWVRCALNFIVPFLVSNAGLLSAHR